MFLFEYRFIIFNPCLNLNLIFLTDEKILLIEIGKRN